MDLTTQIASIENFPKPGITFRDITPILANPEAFHEVIAQLTQIAKDFGATTIVAPEARGFIFAIPVAYEAQLPFVPVRKPGKLPRAVIEEKYDLEYGTDRLQMHVDDLPKGSRVLIVDDLLATGGTVEAISRLIKRAGSEVVGYAFVVELDDLNGREKLQDAPIQSLVHYKGE